MLIIDKSTCFLQEETKLVKTVAVFSDLEQYVCEGRHPSETLRCCWVWQFISESTGAIWYKISARMEKAPPSPKYSSRQFKVIYGNIFCKYTQYTKKEKKN